jgi:hypothetical protein
MCTPIDDSALGRVDRRPIDELLGDSENSFADYSPLLFHLTAPKTEATKLLWYLDKYGVTAAKLFPSYDGAARALKERLLHSAADDA